MPDNVNPFSNIQPVRFWCQKVLPLVYDDSLSYYETLCKFSSKLNEIIETLNNFETGVYNYIDQQIAALTSDWIDKVYNVLDEYTANFDAKLQAEHEWNLQQHANIISQISAQLQTINNALTSGDEATRFYVDSKIAELMAEIPEITSVMVYDPTTGRLVDIQTALDNVYTNLRCCALTAAEYDSLQLTAEKYDAYGLTAYQYDCCGWRYLWPNIPVGFMFSPFTGEWVPIPDVVAMLAQLHRNSSPTAQEYDDAEFTATHFDTELAPTAYQYSWNFPLN